MNIPALFLESDTSFLSQRFVHILRIFKSPDVLYLQNAVLGVILNHRTEEVQILPDEYDFEVSEVFESPLFNLLCMIQIPSSRIKNESFDFIHVIIIFTTRNSYFACFSMPKFNFELFRYWSNVTSQQWKLATILWYQQLQVHGYSNSTLSSLADTIATLSGFALNTSQERGDCVLGPRCLLQL